MPMQSGQTIEHSVLAGSTTLAIIAQVTADNPVASMSVEVYDAAGVLKAAAPPTPVVAITTFPLPSAGTYTLRVRNLGATPINQTTTLLRRSGAGEALVDPTVCRSGTPTGLE
jgi:hypothetical protein